MATKDMRVLFFDKGLYTYTARKLGEFYSKVWYYMPESNAFPCSQFAEIGTGFPEIERVYDFWEYVDKADLIVFPDVHEGKMQAWLRNKGYRVFGSGKSEKLELDKIYHLECLEKAGLPVPYTEVIEGLDNLVSFLEGKKDRYIKTNTYRGDFETYHYVSMAHAKPWVDTLRLKLGVRADKAEFLVQKGIPAACEAGYDGFIIDGKATDNGLCGYEVKDRGFICKVFDQTPEILSNINTKMSPFMSDCRGHFSSEVRITESGKAYYLDPTCYSADTEVLTDQGWKFFFDLDGSEKVCTLDPETRKIEYQKPSGYVTYPFKGDMISISSPKKVIDLLVTPNHSVWGSERVKSAPIKEFRADSLPSKLCLPRTGEWSGEHIAFHTIPAYDVSWTSGREGKTKREYSQPSVDIPMEDWLRFLAIYLGDGSCSRWGVCVAQYDKIEIYEEIIKKLPFNYSRTSTGFNIHSVQLRAHLKAFGICDKKYIPDYVKNLTSEQINVFLDAYILGDGEKREAGGRRIFTTSKQLADDMQELFLKAGSVANIREAKVKGTVMTCGGRSYVRKRNALIISERPSHDTCWIEGQSSCRSDSYVNKVGYDGDVYDVEVPNHVLYVRRNGKPCWSGNCRIPSPPGELMSELYENYAEAFWQIAGGEVPKMKPKAKFGAEIIMTSHWHTDHELCVEYPSEIAKFVKLKNDCRRGKYNYCIPNGDDEFFGAAIYYADTLQGAIDGCLDVAKQIDAHKFHVDSEMFKEALEAVKSGEKFGIKY